MLAVELDKDDSMQILTKLYFGPKLIFTMFILSCTSPMVSQLLQLPWKMKTLQTMFYDLTT